jgi:hypothetical protein
MPIPQKPTQGGPPQNDPTTAGKLDPKAAALYSGIQGVSQVLNQWNERKDAKEAAEAANIAQNLMVAMENNDVATVHEILNDKHSTKVLQKVYKGWLTKAQDAQKQMDAQGKAQKPPDPAVSGFEQGIQQHNEQKQQQGQQGSQPQQMPRSEGGFLLPQAGPTQQIQQLQQQEALRRQKADPGLGQPTQLSSGEQRTAELAKAGLAETPATLAEHEKYHSQIIKAAADVQKSMNDAKKAELEVQVKQLEGKNLQLKGKQAQALDDTKLLTAKTNLDIAAQRLKLLQAKTALAATAKAKQPPAQLVKQVEASDQAIAYAESILKTRGDKGFTPSDVQALQGMLRQAGAMSLSQSITGWWTTHAPSWAGGSGSKDVQNLLDSLTLYKNGLDNTIHDINPDWTSARGGAKKVGDLKDEADTDEPDADIVVDPADMEEKEPE